MGQQEALGRASRAVCVRARGAAALAGRGWDHRIRPITGVQLGALTGDTTLMHSAEIPKITPPLNHLHLYILSERIEWRGGDGAAAARQHQAANTADTSLCPSRPPRVRVVCIYIWRRSQ